MSHPLVEILARIKAEYESALPTVFTEGDIVALLDQRDAEEVAAFEARDLTVAEAVRDECADLASGYCRCRLDVKSLNLNEVIKGVK